MICASKTTQSQNNLKVKKNIKNLRKKFCEFPPCNQCNAPSKIEIFLRLNFYLELSPVFMANGKTEKIFFSILIKLFHVSCVIKHYSVVSVLEIETLKINLCSMDLLNSFRKGGIRDGFDTTD